MSKHSIKLFRRDTGVVEIRASQGVSGEILTLFKRQHGKMIQDFKQTPGLIRKEIRFVHAYKQRKHTIKILRENAEE